MNYYFLGCVGGGARLDCPLQFIKWFFTASSLNIHFKQILQTHLVVYSSVDPSYLTIVRGQNNFFFGLVTGILIFLRFCDLQSINGFYDIFIIQKSC